MLSMTISDAFAARYPANALGEAFCG